MRKWLLSSLGAVAVVAVLGAVAYMVWFRAEPPSAGKPKAPDTVTVKRTDLSRSVTLDGSIGYGSATPFTGRKGGTVTRLPSVGEVVKRGQRLYAVDAKPVVLFLGATPLYRTIDNDTAPGPDIAEVNANLRALGFRAAPQGDHYTSGTAAALKRLQRRIGLDDTGKLSVGDVAVLPKPVRVDALKARPGADAKADLMSLSSTKKRVTAEADPSDVDTAKLTKGSPVTLSLPDGNKTKGTVNGRKTSDTSSHGQGQAPGSGETSGSGGDDGRDKEAITITVDDQAQLSGVESGSVEVTVPTKSQRDVLAVPVEALVAVQEGGFGLQVVTGNGHGSTLVGVDTGMFADGLVQVSGKGVTEGRKVVTIS